MNPRPNCKQSEFIKNAVFDEEILMLTHGDMWPYTWADNDALCVACGDLDGSPISTWEADGRPQDKNLNVRLLNYTPFDLEAIKALPETHPNNNIKPSGVIFVNGVLYMSVSTMNYGEEAHGRRQRYPNAWLVTSMDYGKTWNRQATGYDFFGTAFAGLTFVQFGKNYENARDEYIYACSPGSYRGVAYWENADFLLMGRVPAERILEREAWTFFAGGDEWVVDLAAAKPVFEYPSMTGQNFIQYNAGLNRYFMGNYAFMTEDGKPRPYHQGEFTKEGETRFPTQLCLLEAPEPWGPWSVFHIEDRWGRFGGYQPGFPAKWMSEDGLEMYMLHSSSDIDYRFLVQKLTVETAR